LAETPEDPVCQFDPEKLALRLNATIRGEVSAVPPLVDQIMSLVTEMGCAKGQEFEIRLAVSEALNNAVEHGCGNDPAKRVEICVECDPARGMLIIVRDPGAGFDPGQIPSPIDGQQLFRRGGRGVFLINQLMDEVQYRKGGTEIRMIKRDVFPTRTEPTED
jgi:serine/threonine-protein kinase RsbW